MKNSFEAFCGNCLIGGAVLMVLTMVLHPAGGSLEHLSHIIPVIIISHSLALVALPFIVLGFWGLAKRLERYRGLSTLAFIFSCFGAVAGMGAAAVNGLVLPLLVGRAKGGDAAAVATIKPLLLYNTTLNHAFDFIFIGATCLAVMAWSLVIIRTRVFYRWIGYLGLVVGGGAVLLLAAGFSLVSLHGFRLFIFGVVAWIIFTGFELRRPVAAP